MTKAGDVRHGRARAMVEELAGLDAESPIGNELLSLAREGRLELEHLRRLVAVELQCHVAELSSYGLIMSRFPHSPTAGFYIEVARLVYDAHPKLRECGAALGIPEERFYRWPQGPATQAFAGYISWLALHGTQADNALCLHTDLSTYFPDCRVLVEHLRGSDLKVPEEFLDYYGGGESEEMLRSALGVVDHGVGHGDDPAVAVARARLLHEHIGLFWRAAAGTD
ncbi:hypothetical protein [Bailinhaonella thermotolerans]|uniref:Uncharacterized protein n=1 Tax=Bailinhaonella thermotolerans TaxID=1070861 RepID=A0A3A4AB22_9ACTN|nr:hypothetical protein [Bailinhaonella thermotolerans]RJL23250.1 hypothetical protein D5H75_33310 [Bailinhaonella thermotolerans]